MVTASCRLEGGRRLETSIDCAVRPPFSSYDSSHSHTFLSLNCFTCGMGRQQPPGRPLVQHTVGTPSVVHVIHSPLSTGKEENGVGSGVQTPGLPCPPAHQAVCPLSPAPKSIFPVTQCQAAHLGSHTINDQHSTWYKASSPWTMANTPHSPLPSFSNTAIPNALTTLAGPFDAAHATPSTWKAHRPAVSAGMLSSSSIPPTRTFSPSHCAEFGLCPSAQQSLLIMGSFAPMGNFLSLPLSLYVDQDGSSA